MKANTDPTVIKAGLVIDRTDPYEILDVGPFSSTDTSDVSSLGGNLLDLDLPSDLPGSDICRRVAIERCNSCANPHDNIDMP